MFLVATIAQIQMWRVTSKGDCRYSLKQLARTVTATLCEVQENGAASTVVTMSVLEAAQRCLLIKVSERHIDEVEAPPLQVSTLSIPVRSLVIGDDVK